MGYIAGIDAHAQVQPSRKLYNFDTGAYVRLERVWLSDTVSVRTRLAGLGAAGIIELANANFLVAWKRIQQVRQSSLQTEDLLSLRVHCARGQDAQCERSNSWHSPCTWASICLSPALVATSKQDEHQGMREAGRNTEHMRACPSACSLGIYIRMQ